MERTGKNRKIGCGCFITYEPAQPHDSIQIIALTTQGIIQKVAELYKKGLSTRAIATELKISKTAVINQLNKADIPVRTHSNNQIGTKFNPRKKSIKNAPYGYCLVKGTLLPDPKEQATLQLIINWWKQGMSFCAITRTLNAKKIKPRKSSHWSQPTVGFIIKRHQDITKLEKKHG